MPLQNRVDPAGCVHATPARGTFMGNRGGKIHNPETKTLTRRRWANKAWITCVTSFKDRHRSIMGDSYTELFFLDEVTALAAGHRPCFECRRRDANAFQAAWQQGQGLERPPKVGVMDPVLHKERLENKAQRTHLLPKSALISGMMLRHQNEILAYKDGAIWVWSFDGYMLSTITHNDLPETIQCLTPPAIITVLAHGYTPVWHETAK